MGNMALIDNKFKLLHIGKNKQQNQRYELYDLDSDPTEQKNLFIAQPKTAERMTKLMDQFTRSLQQSIQGSDYPEGSIMPGEPKPRSWTDDPRYKPYFDEWKNRPEYRSRLNRK